MEILIPEGWSDITVNEYQALRSLKREDYEGDLSYTNALLQILCDIPSAELFSMDVLAKIMPYIEFVNTMPSPKRLRRFEHNGDSYEWIGDFGKLTVGEAISIEQIIDLEELTYDQSLDVVLGVLLRKNGESFTSESFNKNRSEFGCLPIDKVIGMLLFFLSGATLSTNNIVDFSIVTATSRKTIQKKSGKLKKLLHYLKKVRLRISGCRWWISYQRETQRMMNRLMK